MKKENTSATTKKLTKAEFLRLPKLEQQRFAEKLYGRTQEINQLAEFSYSWVANHLIENGFVSGWHLPADQMVSLPDTHSTPVLTFSKHDVKERLTNVELSVIADYMCLLPSRCFNQLFDTDLTYAGFICLLKKRGFIKSFHTPLITPVPQSEAHKYVPKDLQSEPEPSPEKHISTPSLPTIPGDSTIITIPIKLNASTDYGDTKIHSDALDYLLKVSAETGLPPEVVLSGIVVAFADITQGQACRFVSDSLVLPPFKG